MSVELVVCLPVILAVMLMVVNWMSYMETCARFDRVAADAVRIGAAAPGYGSYGSGQRAADVRQIISKAMEGSTAAKVSIEVAAGSAKASGQGAGAGVGRQGAAALPMSPLLETYHCQMVYQPQWPAQAFGLNFMALTHNRYYTVDPFRPGVLL